MRGYRKETLPIEKFVGAIIERALCDAMSTNKIPGAEIDKKEALQFLFSDRLEKLLEFWQFNPDQACYIRKMAKKQLQEEGVLV